MQNTRVPLAFMAKAFLFENYKVPPDKLKPGKSPEAKSADFGFVGLDAADLVVALRSHERAEEALKTMLLLRGHGCDRILVYVAPEQVAQSSEF